ncbi:MAG: hypothetical protein V7631_3423 [Massilia sp.]|jgi:hypothetical protein
MIEPGRRHALPGAAPQAATLPRHGNPDTYARLAHGAAVMQRA